MKRGRATIPEPAAAGPPLNPEPSGARREAAVGRRGRSSSDEARGRQRTGAVRTGRAVLDDEGREWLAWALEEFRGDPERRRPVSEALAERTLRPVDAGELEDAESDG